MSAEAVDWLDIVERVKKGDRIALARLGSLVTGHLARAGAYDLRDSWDDVCQDTLVKLLRAVDQGTLRDPRAFVAYTGRVTRTTLVDWIRRNQKGGGAEWAATDDAGAAPALAAFGAELERSGDPDLLLDLERSLAELPEAERDVLAAVYIEGNTYEEAAERLGVPLGTLKRRQTQGLRSLRQKMGLMGLAGKKP